MQNTFTLNDLTPMQIQNVGFALAATDLLTAGANLVTTTVTEAVGDVSVTNSVTKTAAETFAPTPEAPATLPAETPLVVPVETAAPPLELDSRRMPWDARIHGAKKTKNADQTWKYKKSVDKVELVPQVEAEIFVPDTETAAPAAGIPTPPAAGIPTPPAAGIPTPPATERPTTFMQLMPLVMARKNAGQLTQAEIDSVAALHGAMNFGLLAPMATPEIIGAVAVALGV